MTITLDAITLPPDLEWTDEYQWTGVHHQKTISLTGALIVEESAQQKGREITLEGKINSAWITRATLDLLKAKADVAGTQMTLTYYGRAFTVLYRRDRNPIDAKLIVDFANPQADDYYSVKLYLLEI